MRRAAELASQVASDQPAAIKSGVHRIKDPDAWRPKDTVRLLGGLLTGVGLVFLMPMGNDPRNSEIWSRIQASGHLRSGLLLLAAGIVLLGIGSLMRRQE
jgi:hypothetical protein